MYKYFLYIFLLFVLFPISACNNKQKKSLVDNKGYISDFELIKENPWNKNRIRITSPKAIIDPIKSDINIFDSSIKILNENGQNIQVKSGESTLNNSFKLIRVFNNVYISFLNKQDYYITTNSFDWDLNTSIIDINNPVKINFDNTRIMATNGLYNINSSVLNIDNSEFNRYIYNSKGEEKYQVKIKSDFAKWLKKDNTLVFTSNEKQVETTVNFLLTQ